MNYTVADIALGIKRNNMWLNLSKWEDNEFGGVDLVFKRHKLVIAVEDNTIGVYVFSDKSLEYSCTFGELTPLNMVIVAVQAAVTDIESKY